MTRAAQLADRLHLWHAMVGCLAFLCLWDGAGYAYGGNSAGPSPSLAVLRTIPGGLRTHGVLLLVLSAWLAFGLGRHAAGSSSIRWALAALVGYALWTVAAIVATWVPILELAPAPWGAPSKWGFAGTVAVFCRFLRPPPGRADDHR